MEEHGKQQERQVQETCLRYAIAKLVVRDLEKHLLGITLDPLHFLNVIFASQDHYNHNNKQKKKI